MEKTDEIEKKNKERRDQEPLAFCSFIVKYPWIAFGLTLGGHIVFTLINFILLAVGYDIFPVVFLQFPVQLTKDPVAQKEYAWVYRNNDTDRIKRFVLDDLGPTWPRGYSLDDVEIFYESNGQSVFKKDMFMKMEKLEKELFETPEYLYSFCRLDANSECIKPVSILRYFDGTFSDINRIFYDPEYININNVLFEAYNNPQTADDFRYFLSKEYSVEDGKISAPLTRSSIPMGWPLEGDSSNREKQKAIEVFQQTKMKPILQEASSTDFKVVYYSFKFFETEVMSQVVTDGSLAAGSLCFIFIYIWIQTSSFWITGWGVLSIIFCFMSANIFYRTIIGYTYIGYFHVISVFIILGIGADDFFVFYNTWRETAHHEYPSPAHRLSDAYRRAAGAMFVTSFTTMMAFIAGGLSPVLPIGSFGVFTGILIAVNYLSVIIFFPTVIYTYYTRYGDKISHKSCFSSCQKSSIAATTSTDKIVAKSIDSEGEGQRDVVTRFLVGPYRRFITHKIARWPIIVVFLLLLVLAVYSATNIEVDSDQLQIYKENTNFGRAMKLSSSGFVPSGNIYVILYLVWGMHPRDTSHCHFSDWQCTGSQVWDDNFDINTPAAQMAIKNLCTKLKYNLSSEELEKLMIRNNTITQQLEVDCFIDNLESFLENDEKRLNMTENTLNLPLKQDNIEQYMNEQPWIYEPGSLGRTFYRYFEIAISNWMTNSYNMLSTQDYIHFNDLVGEAVDPPYTQEAFFHRNLSSQGAGYYGTKLRYSAIRVNLSLSTQGINYLTGLPVRDNWEKYLKEQVKDLPPVLQNVFQTTEVTWHWLTVQRTLVENAVLGIIIGTCIACPVLILATFNFIIGIAATLIIGCITICVLGFIPLLGWKIDVLVSMNLCLLVGLSVDYIVHLAEAYHMSNHYDRDGRVKDMLQNLGLSVVSGAITTLGAAFFMIFAKIKFFMQFGIFMFCTIGISLLFSLVFFSTTMALCGPQGNTGSLSPVYKFIKRRIIGRKKTDMDCDYCQGTGFISVEQNNIKTDKNDSYENNDDVEDICIHDSEIKGEFSNNSGPLNCKSNDIKMKNINSDYCNSTNTSNGEKSSLNQKL